MKRKIVKSITSWMLVFGLVLSLNSAIFAANTNGIADAGENSQTVETSKTKKNTDTQKAAVNKAHNERLNKINELMDTKDKLLSESDVDQEKLDAVEKELAELGVEKLSDSEVKEKFGTQTTKGTVKPAADIPGQNNISWSSMRDTYYYNGKLYEIQHLYADPNSKNSKLKITGTQVIYTNYNWKAGAMSALKVAAGAVVGEVKIVGAAYTFYDLISGFIKGASKTTVIEGGDVSYTYACSVRVVFTFVKPYGKSDDYQELTYVSSSCKVAVAYNIPTFYYIDLSNRTVKSPDVIQGKKYYSITPSGYLSDYNAVRAYTGQHVQTRATVNYLNINGLGNKVVSKVSVIAPSYPIQLY